MTVFAKMSGFPLLLLLISAFAIHAGSAAYCDDNLFQKNERLHFTKELSGTEYGPLSSFKTLHCCGENYLSLEWLVFFTIYSTYFLPFSVYRSPKSIKGHRLSQRSDKADG